MRPKILGHVGGLEGKYVSLIATPAGLSRANQVVSNPSIRIKDAQPQVAGLDSEANHVSKQAIVD